MQKVLTYIFTRVLGSYINTISYINPNKAQRLAYKFFSEPRDGKLEKDKLPAILEEADAEMITHNECIFQLYTWEGNDKKILLVHGWESNASRWEEFMPYLKKEGYTIIALDAPAHGLSSGKEFNIPRYAEFIDVVVKRFQPDFMVGHSLGGATALYYQSHYKSSCIKKMVVLGAPSDLIVLLNNYKKLLHLNTNVGKLLNKYFLNTFNIKSEEFSGSLFASTIKIPALLAHDKDDEVVNYTEGQKIANAWKSATFVTTNGLGHSMHEDALYITICNFLKEK